MSLIYDLFAESAAHHGGKVALICENQTVTYAGLLRMVDEKADLLPPKLKACTMPVRTDVESAVALLACAKNGVCVMPMPHDAPREEQVRLTHELFRERPDALPFLLLRTSGTTGEPKLIMLEQETKVLRAQQFIGLYGVMPDDVILVGSPLHYSMPLRLVFTSLLCGATARLLPQYSPELWLTEAELCSVVVGVPQQLVYLEHQPRVVLNTSAQRNVARYRDCDCYGTSEIAIATSLRPLLFDAPRVSDIVGCPIPGVSVRISMDGEVEVHTPLLFSGYYKRPELTAAAMTEDGYFRTGDVGYLDELGTLHLLGRLNDVIKVGGVKVYPEHVEAAVGEMPGVVECAAIGVPDDKLGEHVHVAIVFHESEFRKPTLREVQHWCRRSVDNAAMPRSVSFAESLPRTETGKLIRRMLK